MPMQFYKDTPWGGDDFSMSKVIDQLGDGLISEMKQRRQRLNQQSAITGLFPDMKESQVQSLSVADPQLLNAFVEHKLSFEQSTHEVALQLITKLQKEKLDLIYKLESNRQKLETELQEKKQLESQLKSNQLEIKKMITEQREYEQKIEVLSYSVLGLSVLAFGLVLVIIFKRKKT